MCPAPSRVRAHAGEAEHRVLHAQGIEAAAERRRGHRGEREVEAATRRREAETRHLEDDDPRARGQPSDERIVVLEDDRRIGGEDEQVAPAAVRPIAHRATGLDKAVPRSNGRRAHRAPDARPTRCRGGSQASRAPRSREKLQAPGLGPHGLCGTRRGSTAKRPRTRPGHRARRGLRPIRRRRYRRGAATRRAAWPTPGARSGTGAPGDEPAALFEQRSGLARPRDRQPRKASGVTSQSSAPLSGRAEHLGQNDGEALVPRQPQQHGLRARTLDVPREEPDVTGGKLPGAGGRQTRVDRLRDFVEGEPLRLEPRRAKARSASAIIHPRRQLALAAEVGKVRHHEHQDLLRRVFGVACVTEQPERQSVDRSLGPAADRFERASIAGHGQRRRDSAKTVRSVAWRSSPFSSFRDAASSDCDEQSTRRCARAR